MTERRQPVGHPANSTRYKKLRREFMRAQGLVGRCALCGDPVDMSMSGRTAMGPSVDHVVPTSAGGSFFDPTNWQLAHRSCNARKGRGEAVGVARGGGFPPDGHWNDKPDGREWASPNGLGCDNPRCRRCIAEGYR